MSVHPRIAGAGYIVHFEQLVRRLLEMNKQWRRGQAWFNTLRLFNRAWADKFAQEAKRGEPR